MIRLLKRIECKCCGKIFFLCRRCYRGQVYCSTECRKAGYRERHREAQKKYQASEKGSKTRSDAAKRRRKGKKKNDGFFREIMKTCACLMKLFKNLQAETHNENDEKCSFCGKHGTVIEEFPRRPYWRKPIHEKEIKMAYF